MSGYSNNMIHNNYSNWYQKVPLYDWCGGTWNMLSVAFDAVEKLGSRRELNECIITIINVTYLKKKKIHKEKKRFRNLYCGSCMSCSSISWTETSGANMWPSLTFFHSSLSTWQHFRLLLSIKVLWYYLYLINQSILC